MRATRGWWRRRARSTRICARNTPRQCHIDINIWWRARRRATTWRTRNAPRVTRILRLLLSCNWRWQTLTRDKHGKYGNAWRIVPPLELRRVPSPSCRCNAYSCRMIISRARWRKRIYKHRISAVAPRIINRRCCRDPALNVVARRLLFASMAVNNACLSYYSNNAHIARITLS